MADITSDELSTFAASLRNVVKPVETLGEALDSGTGKAKVVLERMVTDLHKQSAFYKALSAQVGNAGERMAAFEKDAGELVKSVAQAASKFGMLGAGVGFFLNTMGQMTGTYRDLSDVGQTFGGNMMEMARAAAQAGLPLDEFAKQVKRNATVVGNVGAASFFEMGKSVRKNLEEFGMFGLTTQETTEYLGDYLETMRNYGNVENRMNQGTAQAFSDLMGTTTGLSAAYGKSRQDILKTMNDAMKDSTVIAKVAQMSGSSQQQFSDSLAKATASMAAQPGQAGTMFANMLNQSVGAGAAFMSKEGQTMVMAGVGQVNSLMDAMVSKVESGSFTEADSLDFFDQFRAEIESNLSGLQVQARAGNAAAQEVLQTYGQMQKVSRAEMQKKMEEAKRIEPITKFFANLESVLKDAFGAFKVPVFEKATEILKKFTDRMEKSDFAARLKEFGTKLGNAVAKLLDNAFSDDNINQIAKFFDTLFSEPADKTLSPIVSFAKLLATAGSALGLYIGGVMAITNGLTGLFGMVTNLLGLSPGIAALAGVLGTMALGSLVRVGLGAAINKLFGSNVTMSARNVYLSAANVPGAAGAAGAPDIPAPHGPDAPENASPRKTMGDRARSAKDFMVRNKTRIVAGAAGLAVGGALLSNYLDGRAGKDGAPLSALPQTADPNDPANPTAAQDPTPEPATPSGSSMLQTAAGGLDMADGALGLLGMFGGKIGKFASKLIPGVGLAASAAGAAMRAQEGDTVGAGMEAFSGLAANIPVVGTATAALTQGVLGLRDYIGRDTFDKYAVDTSKAAYDAVSSAAGQAWNWAGSWFSDSQKATPQPVALPTCGTPSVPREQTMPPIDTDDFQKRIEEQRLSAVNQERLANVVAALGDVAETIKAQTVRSEAYYRESLDQGRRSNLMQSQLSDSMSFA